MSKKWVYEQLLVRLEKLEQQVKYLMFLQEHRKNDILICKYLLDDCDDIEVKAKFVNKDNEVVEVYMDTFSREEFEEYSIEIKAYAKRPFRYIEVRRGGLLEEVFRVDEFLSKLWHQDLTLYIDAYGVEYNTGGNSGSKKSSRKDDDDTA